MRPIALIRATGLTALLGSLAVAAPAQAETITIGSNLAATPSATPVCSGRDGCTLVQTALGPGTGGLATVPSDGVIVRWRVKAATATPSSITLNVLRGNTSVAKSSPRALTTSGIVTFAASPPIAVKQGDRLGVDVGPDNAPIVAFPSSGASVDRWTPALGLNQTRAASDTRPFELLLNADIDPPLPPPPPPPPPPPAPDPVTPPPPGTGTGTGTPITTPPPGGQTPSTQNPATDAGTPLNAAPRITSLLFTPTRISFRISEPASVSLLVQRALPGKRAGARCVKPTRRNRRARNCSRLVRAVTGRTDVEAGLNRARLRRLPAGRYRVRLLSTDLVTRRISTTIRYFRLKR